MRVNIALTRRSRCHIFYSQRVVDIPDGKPKWTKMDEKSELIDEVGDTKEAESVVSKRKLEAEGEVREEGARAEKAAKGEKKIEKIEKSETEVIVLE